MNWHCLPELAEVSWDPTCSAGAASVPWKWSPSAGRSCCGVNGTVCSPCSRSGMTSDPLTADRGVELWMSSLRASRVNRSALPESDKEKTTNAISGPKPSASYAKWDRDSRCWRTSQVSLLTDTLEPFSGTWPKAGITQDGACYRQRKWERRIAEIGYGSWPTPSANDWKGAGNATPGHAPQLRHLVGGTRTRRTWATPKAEPSGPDYARRTREKSGGDDLVTQAGGQLSPDWTEWLMGFPIGLTALEPLGMHRFREWLELHGSC
jgi:hypothetical protein